MLEQPVSFYVRELKPHLPNAVFAPQRNRLVWLLAYFSVTALGIAAVAFGWGTAWAAPLWSLVIGAGFSGLAFVGHEMLHGAVVRNLTLRHWLGFICFLPFSLSPRLWVAWHNRVHHGHTMIDGV